MTPKLNEMILKMLTINGFSYLYDEAGVDLEEADLKIWGNCLDNFMSSGFAMISIILPVQNLPRIDYHQRSFCFLLN